MEVLSHGLRGAITARPGHVLYVSDYASIEARGLLWMAGDEAGLDVFRQHKDVYCELATTIYGHSVTKKDKEKRQLGKIGVLALGYQMGPSKFVDTAATYGITLIEDIYCAVCSHGSKGHDFQKGVDHGFVYAAENDALVITAVKVVNAYRTKFWKVKKLWQETEDAAIEAVCWGGTVSNGQCAWFVRGRFLCCELPSGRLLRYPDPRVKDVPMPWDPRKKRPQLSFMGVDIYTRQWVRQTTYGGSLVENECQAVCRDLMAAALLRCEAHPTYTPVMTIHDELVAEAVAGTGSVDEFTSLMAECPSWAAGLPVECEGGVMTRYSK